MLKGKTALVTGSTSGIGQGIAEALAAQGADIVLNGFGEAAAIEKLRAAIAAEHGIEVAYDGADMSKPAEIARMVKEAEKRFGAVDILVNNAGIQHVAPIEDFPDERWDAIEDCERRFRNARKRVTSENIGLARLNDGLELVRIGDPMRPEFAAWRYGDQFGRRRRKSLLMGTGLVAAGAGLVVAATATGVLSGMGYLVWTSAESVYDSLRDRQVVARIPTPSGRVLVVRGKHLKRMCMHAPEAGHWGLHVPHDKGVEQFVDEEARRGVADPAPAVEHVALLLAMAGRDGGLERDLLAHLGIGLEVLGELAAAAEGAHLHRTAGRPAATISALAMLPG